MCGIVGYIGKEQAAPILLDGLARLEYRGYDSAGICVAEDGLLHVVKSKGRLQNLCEKTQDGKALPGFVGIGHTRWATHGEPNDVNSHPHLSQNGKIALVHNGIIENYMELREALEEKGIVFTSDTDSEVVAQLLEYCLREAGSVLDALYMVLHRIEGAYALGIICADEPDRMYAARKDAPLLLGYGNGCSYIASDVTALVKYTREVSYMEDGEVAILTRDGITVLNAMEIPVQKEHHHIDWEISAAEKGGYPHFMFKEIMEEPEALRRAINPRIKDGRIDLGNLNLTKEMLQGLRRLYIVACGSSYHVGMVGKYNIEKLTRMPVEVTLASEFRYCDPIIDDKTLVIIISQSGETLDTMAALREAKARGARILSIVNVVGSSIARESDDVLYTWAGPEIAVATTKAYSTQLAVLNILTIELAHLLETVTEERYLQLAAEPQRIPDKLDTVLESRETIQYYASQYFNHNSVFFIGRNVDYALGLEGSLKLKEISYIHSEAYASGELKHGTISLIEDGTLVVALGTYGALFDKAMSNVVEVKARGANVLALTTESRASQMGKNADGMLIIPDTEDLFLPSLGVVPLQLFAYYVALQRGCDIDKPRNLAKSVTVE
ncbi:MAG: glutamine--fructose-6-phosphate transaminase (isomerizing) [Clostridia bacterium]|nr:glutamine--fructose-6-phosphate transaminase (isomerizing) [Clostridia bacterium]